MSLPQFFQLPCRAASPPARSRFSVQLAQFVAKHWQRCLWLLSAPEPKVWQTVNRDGQPLFWHVYDPTNGHTQTFGSELEVRLWLEQQCRR